LMENDWRIGFGVGVFGLLCVCGGLFLIFHSATLKI
jgi:hypothetical protein